MNKKGFFLVIDGTDGSGKATQIDLMKIALTNLKVSHEIIDFPRYEDNLYGKLVGRYLKGEFGGLDQVSPYLASLAYAGDRMLAEPLMKKWLQQNKLVISNRYVPSSKAHQSAKLPKKEQASFMQWLDELEYRTNGIPREELVIFLYVPPQIGQKLVEQKESRSYMGGKGKDIHESNLQYQIDSSKLYLQQAKKEKHWVVIKCTKKGQMRSREEIHAEIMQVLAQKGITPKETSISYGI